MTTQEKILYHQIHPLKLLTDISTGIYSTYLLWQRHPLAAFLVSSIPPVAVSLFLINTADLEPYKRSAFGRYVARIMSPTVQGLRLLGFVMMSVGAWTRRPWLIAAASAEIVLCWTHGLLLPSHRRNGAR